METLLRIVGWFLVVMFMLGGLGGVSRTPSASFCLLVVSGVLAYALLRDRGQAEKRDLASRQKDNEALVHQLLSQPLTEVRPSRARLKPGERAYAVAGANLLEMQTVGYSAGTRGMSVRVVKGVTLRSGGVRGHAVKGAVAVASGELVITNTRLIFAGDTKSFVIPLEDLLTTTPYSDGFGFSDGNKTYTLRVDGNEARLTFGVVLEKVLSGASALPAGSAS